MYQVYECAVRNSVDTSVNGHVMMVQRFECQSDPGGYVVGAFPPGWVSQDKLVCDWDSAHSKKALNVTHGQHFFLFFVDCIKLSDKVSETNYILGLNSNAFSVVMVKPVGRCSHWFFHVEWKSGQSYKYWLGCGNWESICMHLFLNTLAFDWSSPIYTNYFFF